MPGGSSLVKGCPPTGITGFHARPVLDQKDDQPVESACGRVVQRCRPRVVPGVRVRAPGEEVVLVAALPTGASSLVAGTAAGRVKRTMAPDLAGIRGTWQRVVGLSEADDRLLFGGIAAPRADALFATAGGQVLRTPVDAITPQASGSARGVAAIAVGAGDRPIGGAVVNEVDAEVTWVYVVTAAGFVKRVPLADYPVQGRAGKGVQTIRPNTEIGAVVAVAVGRADGGLDVLFANGRRQSIAASDVPAENRYNRGRRLVDVVAAQAEIVGAVVL